MIPFLLEIHNEYCGILKKLVITLWEIIQRYVLISKKWLVQVKGILPSIEDATKFRTRVMMMM